VRDASSVDITEKNNVLLCLPSNMTHQLQLFNKGIYCPVEAFSDKILNYWTTHTSPEATCMLYI
jgi:hypothetical protein